MEGLSLSMGWQGAKGSRGVPQGSGEVVPPGDRPEHEDWPAFVVPWDDVTTGPTDMAGLLKKPAGADGFIQVVDGHLATGDGARWRFWGVGQVYAAFFPPMDLAGVIARRMAKFGINCLRLHPLDHRWPNGVLLWRTDTGKAGPGTVTGERKPHPGRAATRALDPEALARLDWFIACCKANGIYIDLNLNVSRQFSVGDGVKDVEYIGFGKGLTYFDERLIFLQQEYARQLLDHVNPFTGNRYADEPAIALIEIVNEQSLLQMWRGGKLRGQQTAPSRHDRPDIPPSYAADLDRLWNRWLARRYDGRAALATAWEHDLREHEDAGQGTVRRLCPEEFAGASAGRFRDEARFYAETEQAFFRNMEAFLRGTVGAQQLIVGGSDWGYGYSALAALEGLAKLDVMDGHKYWREPREPGRTTHLAQVDHPDRSLPALLSRTIVKDRPYIVSEINEWYPNDHYCECIPLVAAYASLQDWDGIFWHSYTGGPYPPDRIWQQGAIDHQLRLVNDPVRMTQLAAGALLFLRGDVRAAERTVERRVPHDWALESTRVAMPDEGHPYWLPYLPGRLGLVHRTVLADFHADRVTPTDGEIRLPKGRIVSDTGELVWEEARADGRILVDAPRHQALIMRAGERATSNLGVALATPFAAVQLASLDARPIARADRLLLVAVARAANTGMRWDNERRSVKGRWGGPPTRIEPVRATVTLRDLEGAIAVRLQPLDGRGRPLGAPRLAAGAGEGFTIELTGEPGTTWYVLEVERRG